MLPDALIDSLNGVTGFDRSDFVKVHEAARPPVSIRLNPQKLPETQGLNFPISGKVPWAKNAFYLAERPSFTLDPLLHAGAYYVQEASSMFMEQAIKKILHENQPVTAIDLCAAPGGKSTHLLSLLPRGSVLVSNEVIQSRVVILLENLVKWGSAHTIVTNNDPRDFGRLGPMFDLMVVDAPCSGSGLFRRDPDAIKEWSPHAVELCAQRQQRILADALPCLKPGGFLVYSTCSYSPQEDEIIIDWLAKEYGMEGIDLQWQNGNQGVVAANTPNACIPVYRFFPDKVTGEGFFITVLQQSGTRHEIPAKRKLPKEKEQPLPGILASWVKNPRGYCFFQNRDLCFAMPHEVYPFFHRLKTGLNIRKAGVKMAEQVHSQYNPTHDLALLTNFDPSGFQRIETSQEEAIAFLRKEEFPPPSNLPKGWILVEYKGLPIGWLKYLGNRANNYYPKEWRIKMKG